METLNYAKPSIMSLFKALTSDTKTLIRQEVQLAKTEISEKVSSMGKNVAMVAVGGFVAYAGAIVFIIGLGWLIGWALEAAGLSPALARFIGLSAVGLLVALTGYIVLSKALRTLKQESLKPERTIQTIQELKSGSQPDFDDAELEAHEEKVNSEAMQARVEATETRMSDTLEELGYRFNPRIVKERVTESLSERPYRAGLIAMGCGLVSGLLLRRKFSHSEA